MQITSGLEGIDHPKLKFCRSRVNPQDICSSSEHKISYFWLNLRAFWPSIDSNATTTFKAQKGSKDIVKIVHVTSVVPP